jgi:hypothetical protein
VRDSVLLPVGSVISQTGQCEWDGEVVSEGLGGSSLRLQKRLVGANSGPALCTGFLSYL